MSQRSVIIYTRTTPPPDHLVVEYQKIGPVWVRALTVEGSPSDALDHAGVSLRVGESVSNSHPLPDVPHHRLLVEGEIAKEGDEATLDSGATWALCASSSRGCAPLPGEAFCQDNHFPVRRRIAAYIDAY